MVKGFEVFAVLIRAVITAGLVLAAVTYMTGFVVIPGMAPVEEAMAVVSSIGVVLLGSLPVTEFLQRILKRPCTVLGAKIGLDSISVLGLLVSIVSPIPALAMMKDMNEKGKLVNVAYMVSAASMLAAHLGFTVSTEPDMLPVLLISVSSFAQMYAAEGSAIYTICTTIGNKVIALSIGLLYSFYLGYKQRKMVLGVYADTYNEPKAKLGEVMLNKWVARGLVVCLSPLLITAMGGAFGNVLKNSPALEPLSKLIADSPIPAILVPWAIAAIMMTSVGSMTTAGMTAAAIVLPMMPDLGLSSLAAVLAIGSGTLMGNHYNNSGFWVMGQFFHLNTKQSVKYVTVPCAVASVICLIAVVILNAVGVFG